MDESRHRLLNGTAQHELANANQVVPAIGQKRRGGNIQPGQPPDAAPKLPDNGTGLQQVWRTKRVQVVPYERKCAEVASGCQRTRPFKGKRREANRQMSAKPKRDPAPNARVECGTECNNVVRTAYANTDARNASSARSGRYRGQSPVNVLR